MPDRARIAAALGKIGDDLNYNAVLDEWSHEVLAIYQAGNHPTPIDVLLDAAEARLCRWLAERRAIYAVRGIRGWGTIKWIGYAYGPWPDGHETKLDAVLAAVEAETP